MKSFLLLLPILLLQLFSHAQQQLINQGKKNLSEMSVAQGTIIFSSVHNTVPGAKDVHLFHVLSLEINPATFNPAQVNDFSVSAHFIVTTTNNAVLTQTQEKDLIVHYNSSGTYKAKDEFEKADADLVEYKLVSVSLKNSGGAAIAIDASNQDFVVLKQHLQFDRFLPPNPLDHINVQNITVSKDSGYANLSWSPVSWAVAYDIEYSFIDNYTDDPLHPVSADNASYNFRFNCTRVQLKKTTYEIPLVYESGYLFYRVRPVGYWGGQFDKTVVGQWSVPDAAQSLTTQAIGGDGNFFCRIEKKAVHEDDKKNWQYVVNFSEEGKRKDHVVYFDGTSRDRQEVENSNTQQNLVVNETIYDNAGRAAIDVLPTPVVADNFPGSHIPRIAYQNAFNTNSAGKSYSWKDFDVDRPTCTLFPDKFDNKSGAGNYYSPANKIFDAGATGVKRQMAFVADASGYPFTQKEYTPDNSGRISRQSMPGAEFSFGSTPNASHEQHFFYGTPSQQELDRVFGNDIGFASHYTKQISIDGDGLAQVTYKNLKGNIVATALAGDPPPNLAGLSEPITKRHIIVNLSEERNQIDLKNKSLVATFPLVIAERTKINLDYSLNINGLPFSICNQVPDNLCYDCVYDLTIKLTDACGKDYINPKIKVASGTLNNLRKCENGASSISAIRSPIELEPGSYFISKILTVSDSAINAYITDNLKDPCWKQIPQPADPVDCIVTKCSMDTVSVGDGCHTDTLTNITTPSIRFLPQPPLSEGECEPIVENSLNAISIQKMLADLSPTGQYGEYPSGAGTATSVYQYPLSIFNDHNQLPTRGNWRYPVYHYRNKNGKEIFIQKELGGVIVQLRPEELPLEEFLQNWDPYMAYSLLPYHPEYCYYEWNILHKDFFKREEEMRRIPKYTSAKNKYDLLLTGPFENPDPEDPLFTQNAALVPIMSGFMKDISSLYPGGGFNSMRMADAAAAAAAGFSRDVTPTDVSNYLLHHTIFKDDDLKDQEWQQFKNFYLQARTKIIEDLRNKSILNNDRVACCMLNDYIGNDACSGFPKKDLCALFADKKPVFPRQSRLNALIEASSSLPIPAPGSDINCINCTQPQNYMQFINELFANKQLFLPMRISGKLLGMIANHKTDIIIAAGDHIKWQPANTINTLQAKLIHEETGDVICTIALGSINPSFDWKNMIYFSCLKADAPTGAFMLTAWDGDGNQYPMKGNSDCFKIKECAPSSDFVISLGYKEYTGLFIDMLDKVLKSASANVIPSEVVRGRNPNPTYPPDGDPVSLWHITNNTTVSNSFAIPLNFLVSDNTPILNLIISATNNIFTDFADWKITKSEPIPFSQDQLHCVETNTLRLFVQKRSQPLVTDFFDVSFDFPLGTWCKSNRADAFCCMPVLTGLPERTEPSCVKIQQIQQANNQDILNNQIKQHFADSLRTAYISHCLHPLEKFTVAYDEQLYHYTLFYYDQTGNLVRTVPPKGVVPLADDKVNQTAAYRTSHTGSPVFTEHTMVSVAAFNSSNNIINQNTPDAGTSRYCYDEADRLIYQQNANQSFNPARRRATFTDHDSIGRVIQTGEIPIQYAVLPSYLSNEDFKNELFASNEGKTDVFTTFYDRVPSVINGGFDFDLNKLGQQNLRNRVSATIFHRSFQDPSTIYQHAFYYDYDIEGNIHTVVEDSRFLDRFAPVLSFCDNLSFHRFKTIHYDYDLISKNVNRICYQPNQTDQLIHLYNYDADNRLVNVKTTTRAWEYPADIDVDASYQFYLHGPISRMELGQEKIQGLDYIYTLQGRMKGLNSTLVGAGNDPGKDDGSVFLKDAFAYGLNYFPGDYVSISKKTTQPDVEQTGMGTGFSKPLYSGNIRNMIATIDFPNSNEKIQAASYSYDVLSRLLNMQVYKPMNTQTAVWQGGAFKEFYRTQYTYDANSNLSTLLRNNDAGHAIDQLSYTNTKGTNRTEKIADAITNGTPDDLLPDNKNTYDAGGRLSSHTEGPSPAGVNEMTWSAFDRLRNVKKDGSNIEFIYNASSEKVFRYDEATKTATYYVRDIKGQVMAIYEFEAGKEFLEEFPLYAMNRIGSLRMHTPVNDLASIEQLSYSRGTKEYELVNHLGNVMVTVSDRRIPDPSGWKVDILTAQDYYPFGNVMIARSFKKAGVPAYRYGFNGKEIERGIDDRNLPLNFGARMYASGSGQWYSVDPLANKFAGLSPYNYCLDNPVKMVDVNGTEPETPGGFYVQMHVVQWPFPAMHASIIYRPTDQSIVSKNPSNFIYDKKSKSYFMTFGGGPDLNQAGTIPLNPFLVGNTNRSRDINLDIKAPEHFKIDLGGKSEQEVYDNLLKNFNNYNGNPPLNYDMFPNSSYTEKNFPPNGINEMPYGVGYNSNSFVSGLIKSAGLVPPSIPDKFSLPGYKKPVPSENFEAPKNESRIP